MTNTEIIDRIRQLKKEKNAVILAHYYTRPEVQDIADYLGDSLGSVSYTHLGFIHRKARYTLKSSPRNPRLKRRESTI